MPEQIDETTGIPGPIILAANWTIQGREIPSPAQATPWHGPGWRHWVQGGAWAKGTWPEGTWARGQPGGWKRLGRGNIATRATSASREQLPGTW
jgi:hypothetical protein